MSRKLSATEARARIKKLNKEERDLREAAAFQISSDSLDLDFDGEDYFIKLAGEKRMLLTLEEIRALKKLLNSKIIKESLR
jgi:DNA-binding SARP family transcriptional activator